MPPPRPPRSRIFALLLLLLLLVPPCRGARGQETWDLDKFKTGAREAKFRYDPPGVPLPIVYVRFDLGEPVPMVLDTGAPMLAAVDSGEADGLGVRVENGASVPSLNGVKRGKAGLVGIVLVPRGDEPTEYGFRNAPIAVRDLGQVLRTVPTGDPRHPHPVGIVGAPFLSGVTTHFDFAAGRMLLQPERHPPLRTPGAKTTPLDQDEATGWCYLPIPEPGGKSARFLIDTGAVSMVCAPGTAARFGALPTPYRVEARTMTGTRENQVFFLPELRLADERVTAVTVTEDAVAERLGAALLGMEVLRRFQLTIDGFNSELHLSPAGAMPPRWRQVQGMPGLRLAPQPGGPYRVETVLPGSAAQRAGVRAGDLVLDIDGEATSDLSPSQAGGRLAGASGTTARLKLRGADGREREASFPRTPLSWAAPDPERSSGVSFEMRPAPGGSEAGEAYQAVVTAVAPGSPAEAAGVKAGDTIESVGGKPVKDAAWEFLMRDLNRVEAVTLELSLRSPGGNKPRTAVLRLPQKSKGVAPETPKN